MGIRLMAILIAGCGYVGRELARQLVADGHRDVLGLRRSQVDVAPGVRTVAADLLDPESLRRGLPADAQITHVAYAASADGSTRDAYLAAYRDGWSHLRAVLAERGDPVDRAVLVSSTGVYGHGDGRWVDEDTPPEPRGETGPALLEAEEAALAADVPYPTVVLRLAGIYGPGRTRLVDQVRTGQAPRGNPDRYTNRLHRDDCARAVGHLLLRVPDPAPRYLGADDEPVRMRDVRAWLAETLGVPLPPAGGDGGGDGTRVPGIGKRCRNARLRGTGLDLRYPTFREGYGALIRGEGDDSGNAG